MSDELIRKTPKPKSNRKPISCTYDTHNLWLVVLFDDGSLWRRFSDRDEFGAVSWKWAKLADVKEIV